MISPPWICKLVGLKVYWTQNHEASSQVEGHTRLSAARKSIHLIRTYLNLAEMEQGQFSPKPPGIHL